MVWFNLSWSAGFGFGPLLAGPLYDYLYWSPFVAIAVLGAMVVTLLHSIPHERDFFAAAAQEVLAARAEHDRQSEAFLYAAWCATLVANALTNATRAVYAKRVEDLVIAGRLRLLFERMPAEFMGVDPATKYSLAASALALTTALCFVVLGRTQGWRHRVGLLFGTQAAAAGACWLLGNTDSLLIMAACFAVVGANHGVAFFSSVYYSVANATHKHRRTAINEAAVGVGCLAGGLLYGFLAQHAGIGRAFEWTPAVVGAALAVQCGLLRYGRRRWA